MKYLKVKWIHSKGEENEPILIYSEIDNDGWEKRKVEVYGDGCSSYASNEKCSGDTKLSLEPIPNIGIINSQDKFSATEIQMSEFERVWESAQSEHLPGG